MTWPDDYINKVICGDCLTVMKGIPDGAVDLVVTDPPYGIGLDYGVHKDEPDAYWGWFEPRRLEMLRLSENVIFSHRQEAVKHITDWRHLSVWHKPLALGFSHNGWLAHWEPLFVYGKPTNVTYDVFSFNSQKPNGHPCPKPLDLMRRLISIYDSEIILDPFAGSGTTLVAAKQLGRKYIGIEINPDYCKIAEQRLAQEELFG